MSLPCTDAEWNPTGVRFCNKLLVEGSNVAVGASSIDSLATKPMRVQAAAAGQHMMYHWQDTYMEIPAAGTEIDLRQGFDQQVGEDAHLIPTIFEELHERPPMQVTRDASTALPTCEDIPNNNSGTGPQVLPPEPSFIPIPNLLKCAETAMASGEAQVSPGWDKLHECFHTCEGDRNDEVLERRLDDETVSDADIEEELISAGNSCPSNLQRFEEAVLEVYDNASLRSTPHKHGVTLMVSNLRQCTPFSDVVQILKEHGCYSNLVSFKVPTHNSKRKKGRGYVFLQFDCSEAALQCFKAFNGRYINQNKPCVVSLAHEQNNL